jgi:hypothetical protein
MLLVAHLPTQSHSTDIPYTSLNKATEGDFVLWNNQQFIIFSQRNHI